jgi:hypothetical protein
MQMNWTAISAAGDLVASSRQGLLEFYAVRSERMKLARDRVTDTPEGTAT